MALPANFNDVLTSLANSLNTPQVLDHLMAMQHADLPKGKALIALHDLLLYNKAYPQNEKHHHLAKQGLQRIESHLATLSKKELDKYTATGLPYSSILCGFSRPIVSWLVSTFPQEVTFYSIESEDILARKIFQMLISPVEYEYCLTEVNAVEERLYMLSGTDDKCQLLKWLLQTFEQSALPEPVKDDLFVQLKVFVQWQLNAPIWSRSFLSLGEKELFYHHEFIKSVRTSEELATPLPKPIPMSLPQKMHLVGIMRASLAYLLRETEPVTDALPSSVKMYDVGRGVQVGLVGMQVARRLPLESYMGFMAFKNGIPVAYGGAWIWGVEAKIGVNIYEPFRKGESAWLFTQIMRVYSQAAGVSNFSVEPYQFGAGNSEGLKSGAFWFYYKLGFRPEDEKLASLAQGEWHKIGADKQYRTTIQTLLRFTKSNMRYITVGVQNAMPAANIISLAITDSVHENYGGNRQLALRSASKKLKYTLRQSITDAERGWLLLYSCLDARKVLSERQKDKFLKLMEAKCNGDEWQYISMLRRTQSLFVL